MYKLYILADNGKGFKHYSSLWLNVREECRKLCNHIAPLQRQFDETEHNILRNYNARRNNWFIEFDTEEDALAFKLRWSS